MGVCTYIKKLNLSEIEKPVSLRLRFKPSYILWGLSYVVMILVSISSCRHEPFEPTDPMTTDTVDTTGVDTTTVPDTTDTLHPCDPDSVYFKRDVLPILVGNCAMSGCHDAVTANKDVVLESYETVTTTADVDAGDPDASKLYQVLVETDPEDRMPYQSDPLSADQIALIRTWIAQGALDLTCDDPAFCDTTNIAYSGFISQTMQNKGCVGCHNETLASGNVQLHDHMHVSASAQSGALLGSIKHESGYQAMPQNQDKLDDCTIAKIEAWILAGAPNN